MEKVKINYKKVSIELFFIFVACFVFAILMEIVPLRSLYQIPIWIFFIMLFYFILDRTKWFGYFIGKDGICLWINGNFQIIKWDEVTIGKDFLGEKIILSKIKKNYYINTVSNKSLFALIKKHCPPGHELYKYVEAYTKEKNIPF